MTPPRVGDKVRVRPSRDHEYGGMTGEVVEVSDLIVRWPIRVDIPGTRRPMFAADELEVVT